jgi:hypothetical protein
MPGECIDRSEGSFDRRLRDILSVLLIERVVETVNERHEDWPDFWKQQAPRCAIPVLAPPAERLDLLEFRPHHGVTRAV